MHAAFTLSALSALVSTAMAANAIVRNNCPFTVYVAGRSFATLAPQQTYSQPLDGSTNTIKAGVSVIFPSFKLKNQGRRYLTTPQLPHPMGFDYTVSDQTYYDLSTLNGDPFMSQGFSLTHASGNCPEIHCPGSGSNTCYGTFFPNGPSAVLACGSLTDWTLTNNAGAARQDIDSNNGPSASRSSPTKQNAPTICSTRTPAAPLTHRTSLRDSHHAITAQRRVPLEAPPSAFKVPSKPTQATGLAKPSLERSRSTSGTSSSRARIQSTGGDASISETRRTSSTRTASQTRSAMPRTPITENWKTSQKPRRPSAAHTESDRPIARPTFSIYQQHFTPAKKLPRRSESGVGGLPPRRNSNAITPATASSTLTPTAPSHTSASATNQPEPPSKEQVRQQTHLLHLSILHSNCKSTHAAWLASAHTKLESRFLACQSNYAHSLQLARSVRQARNLLALHRWSNGNVASLSRKLGVLADVLREVCALVEDGRKDEASGTSDGAVARKREGVDEDAEQRTPGAFTRVAHEFGAWQHFVQSVWASRDRQADEAADTPPLSPSAGESKPNQLPAGYETNDDDIDPDNNNNTIQRIPGLGDNVKSTLRSMSATLDRLSARLGELRNPPIPSLPVPLPIPSSPLNQAQPHVPNDASSQHKTPTSSVQPTPRQLIDLSHTLVEGMREEVQAMREAEFEVVIGEKAWMELAVRRLGGDVVGAFGGGGGTPMGLRVGGFG